MVHYAFQVEVTMKKLYTNYDPKLCWKSNCKEKTAFIFNFMDMQFPTCMFHAEEFLKILQETHRIFQVVKEAKS